MTADQPHLFDAELEPAERSARRAAGKLPLSSQPNPMVRIYGPDAGDRQCGDCAFLVWKGGNGSHRYFGCTRRGKLTNGPATDHLVRWEACSLFTERPEAKS